MDMACHPLLAAIPDDPPPFPASFPQLSRLDRSVACPICKETFAAPVTVTCGHSFCSQCIRSSLDVMKDKRCPICDGQISEGSIRRNRALEEITDAWEAARPTIIGFCTNAQAGPSKRKSVFDNSSRTPTSGSGTKRPREASHSRSASPAKMQKVEEGFEILDSDDTPQDGEEELDENDDGECPICQARLPIASIPLHIDRGCPPPKQKVHSSGNQKADWKRVFAGAGTGKDKKIEMERIRKPNYAIAQPSELRKILQEYSLPTTGDKPLLQWRIQQWIILFNANLDTSHPQSVSALRAKLKSIETARQRDKEKGKEEKISDIEQYAKDKKGEFERLRKEIMERDKKRVAAAKGLGAESPIEVD